MTFNSRLGAGSVSGERYADVFVSAEHRYQPPGSGVSFQICLERWQFASPCSILGGGRGRPARLDDAGSPRRWSCGAWRGADPAASALPGRLAQRCQLFRVLERKQTQHQQAFFSLSWV